MHPDTYKEFAKLCPLAVTEGVEVTVALPEKKKAKRKAFDVEAYVRREIQKARRENQELLHKAHFLCMLGHLRYLSGKISTSKITLGCALSVVPKVSEGYLVGYIFYWATTVTVLSSLNSGYAQRH